MAVYLEARCAVPCSVWVQLTVKCCVFVTQLPTYFYTQTVYWSFWMVEYGGVARDFEFFFKTGAHVTRVSSSSWHFFSSCRHLASTEAVGVCWCCLGRGWVNKARSTDEIPQVVSRTICFSHVFTSLGEVHGITVSCFTNLDLPELKQPVVAKLPHRPRQQFTLTSASRSASA